MLHPFISRHANKRQILWSLCHLSIENNPPTDSSRAGVSVGALGPQGSGAAITHHVASCRETPCPWLLCHFHLHFFVALPKSNWDYQGDVGKTPVKTPQSPAAVFETPIVITAWNIVWNQELPVQC